MSILHGFMLSVISSVRVAGSVHPVFISKLQYAESITGLPQLHRQNINAQSNKATFLCIPVLFLVFVFVISPIVPVASSLVV